jgi:hypothetical protein
MSTLQQRMTIPLHREQHRAIHLFLNRGNHALDHQTS